MMLNEPKVCLDRQFRVFTLGRTHVNTEKCSLYNEQKETSPTEKSIFVSLEIFPHGLFKEN